MSWNQVEIQYVIDHYKNKTASEIGKDINKSRSIVKNKILYLRQKGIILEDKLDKSLYTPIPNEKWKKIKLPDIQDFYLISSLGRVYSELNERLIRPQISQNGYLKLSLKCIVKNSKTFTVHRLVALHFIPNSEPGIRNTVNHIDGNKLNNNVKNLEWLSLSDNIQHAYDMKIKVCKTCENHHNSKYSNDTVTTICKLIGEGKKNQEICIAINLPYTKNICKFFTNIRTKKNWKNISDKYF